MIYYVFLQYVMNFVVKDACIDIWNLEIVIQKI